MGFRFRRSFTIFPGVKINLGKEGISSVSVGKRGAHITVGKNGTRETIGLPGSGLSFTNYQKHQPQKNPAPVPAAMDARASLRCPYCNAITKRGVNFCQACGANLTQPIQTEEQPVPFYKWPKFWLWLIFTLIIPPIGFAIGLFWLLYTVYKNRQK